MSRKSWWTPSPTPSAAVADDKRSYSCRARRWLDQHPLTEDMLQLALTALVVGMLMALALTFHLRYVQPYVTSW